ncbi:MAG: glycosyltransferase family 2 protein [Deltaproteobacteria bacterium]|nr:glycosyltransferase family 2 protein [Deltaproteobacteria bacterium]
MSADSHMPSVAVIVLNWNGTADTIECLTSLRQSTYPRAEIVVVDNGSCPSPRARIQSEFPSVTYLENPRNLGYAGGNNVGLRYAVQHNHDYAFVLNNDTCVEPGFLSAAVAVAERDRRIAAVGAKVLAFEDPGTVWVAYGKLIYRKGLVRLVGYYKPDNGRFDKQRDVHWVPGTAALLRRSAIEQIGLFDEMFFAYHEDVDWCTRARAQGWRVVYAPSATVLHKGHRSTGGKAYVSPRQYLSGRNMVLFVCKHANWYQRIKFTTFQVTTLPLQYLWRCLSGEQRGVVLKARGMLDALRGRPIPLAELGLQ